MTLCLVSVLTGCRKHKQRLHIRLNIKEDVFSQCISAQTLEDIGNYMVKNNHWERLLVEEIRP